MNVDRPRWYETRYRWFILATWVAIWFILAIWVAIVVRSAIYVASQLELS
jgi:hypothetical protein